MAAADGIAQNRKQGKFHNLFSCIFPLLFDGMTCLE